MHKILFFLHFFHNTGGVDYTPKVLSLVFAESSEDQVQCKQFSIIQDGLEELQEDFRLELTHGEVILAYVQVSIVACKSGGKCIHIYIAPLNIRFFVQLHYQTLLSVQVSIHLKLWITV